LPSEDIRNTAN